MHPPGPRIGKRPPSWEIKYRRRAESIVFQFAYKICLREAIWKTSDKAVVKWLGLSNIALNPSEKYWERPPEGLPIAPRQHNE